MSPATLTAEPKELVIPTEGKAEEIPLSPQVASSQVKEEPGAALSSEVPVELPPVEETAQTVESPLFKESTDPVRAQDLEGMNKEEITAFLEGMTDEERDEAWNKWLTELSEKAETQPEESKTEAEKQPEANPTQEIPGEETGDDLEEREDPAKGLEAEIISMLKSEKSEAEEESPLPDDGYEYTTPDLYPDRSYVEEFQVLMKAHRTWHKRERPCFDRETHTVSHQPLHGHRPLKTRNTGDMESRAMKSPWIRK